MALQKLVSYSTSTGMTFYAKSHKTIQNYLNKILRGTQTAIFTGETFGRIENMEKVARGIYKK